MRGAQIFLALGLILRITAAHAGYPERAIHILVSTAPGTAPDIVARVFSVNLGEQLGQAVVVENRPGANGNVAVGEVARAAPDGYTLLVAPAGTLAANVFLYPKSATAALAEVSPVAQLVSNDFFITARPGLNIKSFADLLAYLRKNPGKINFATSSRASYPNIAAEMLKRFAALDFLIVPFNGGAAAANAVVGQQLDAMIDAGAVVGSFVKAGKLVMLASTGEARNPDWPDVPTVLESGVKNYVITGYIALEVPKGTPEDVRDVLYHAIKVASADPTLRARMNAMQLTPVAAPPETLAKVISSDRERLSRVLDGPVEQ